MEGPVGSWAPAAGGAPWIASVGHSDHSEAAFFALLAAERVGVVVDVRSHPVSQVAHFAKDALVASCRANRLAYHHLGDLGGLRRVPYAEHMEGAPWQRAYARLKGLALEALAEGRVAVFLCVERDPADCHRRFIARALEAEGWRVRHVLPDAGQTRLF